MGIYFRRGAEVGIHLRRGGSGNSSKKGAEVGRGKASRTSSTPSEPRLREC